MIETFLQDLKFGVRTLVKTPNFTVVAAAALALGIGANTAIFSVVNAVLLRPLPYPQSGQLVRILKEKASGAEMPVLGGGEFIGGPEFIAWKEQSQSLSKLAAFGGGNFNLTGVGDAERILCGEITSDFFGLLGIRLALGRDFSPDDDRPNAAPVAILGHEIWRRRFGADAAIVGKTVTLNNKTYSIIGVLPASFQFTEPFEVWLPMALDHTAEAGAIRISLLKVLARIKPTTTIESARAELETITRRMQAPSAGRPSLAPLANAPGEGPVTMPFDGMSPAGNDQLQKPAPAAPEKQMVTRPFPGPGAPQPKAAPGDAVVDNLAIPEGSQKIALPFPPGGDPLNQGAPMITGDLGLPMLGPPGRIKLIGLHEHAVGNARPALLALLAAVAFVLLIACANTANLLLARAFGRKREIAIRAALGAKRSRVVRQLLTESLVLALTGGALGLLVARWGLDLLRAMSLTQLPHVQRIGIDGSVLGFTLIVSVLTGLAFGLAPALYATRTEVNDSLKDGAQNAVGSVSRHWLRNLLVASEVALALVLLLCAGLMIRSFVRLRDVPPGFDPRQVLTLQLQLARPHASRGQTTAFYRELLQRLQSLPGVRYAGITDHLPLTDYSMMASVQVEGRPSSGLFGKEPPISAASVSPDYFRAMGIPLKDGRMFTDGDTEGAPPVAVVNQAFAKRFFGTESAIGKRMRGAGADDWQTIVGVVGDVRQDGLDRETTAEIYRCYLQGSTELASVAIRTAGDPASLIPTVRREVTSLNKDQPIYHLMTMEQRLAQLIAPRQTNTMLLGAFAALALALAAVGIYGVVAFSVSQRTHEIGVRMALGAERRDVLRLIARQGMTPVLCGIVLGLAAALLVTPLMSGLLFGINPRDLATFGVVPLLLVGVALVACLIPARKATQVDPIVALRNE